MAKVKADLHNHLRTSGSCNDNYFNRTIDAAAERLGSGAIIGLTNFSENRYEEFAGLKGYERISVGENGNGIYIPEKDVLVVKAQEVSTKQGHILVIGLGKDVRLKKNRDLADTIKEATCKEGVIVAAHPFHLYGTGKYLEKNPQLLKSIDAIEVHNGEAGLDLFFSGANRKAQEFYEKMKKDYPNLGALAASDGHSIYELGSSWTEIDAPEMNKENFSNSLWYSIRRTDANTPKQKKDSIIGAIDHSADLILLAMRDLRLGRR